MKKIEAIVNKIMKDMGFISAQVDIFQENNVVSIHIKLSPEESGLLIGFHGENIEALRIILSLIINNHSDQFFITQVNVNDYRERRQQSLEGLAQKATDKAIQSGKEILLPPMSSSERRIIHLFLESINDVTSYSEGEGSQRRIIVRPKTKTSNEI